jgi:hypothetical protein
VRGCRGNERAGVFDFTPYYPDWTNITIGERPEKWRGKF